MDNRVILGLQLGLEAPQDILTITHRATDLWSVIINIKYIDL